MFSLFSITFPGCHEPRAPSGVLGWLPVVWTRCFVFLQFPAFVLFLQLMLFAAMVAIWCFIVLLAFIILFFLLLLVQRFAGILLGF